MAPRRPQKPAPAPSELLERIERHYDRLDEKLQEVEALLPDLPIDEAPPEEKPRRQRRKPR